MATKVVTMKVKEAIMRNSGEKNSQRRTVGQTIGLLKLFEASLTKILNVQILMDVTVFILLIILLLVMFLTFIDTSKSKCFLPC